MEGLLQVVFHRRIRFLGHSTPPVLQAGPLGSQTEQAPTSIGVTVTLKMMVLAEMQDPELSKLKIYKWSHGPPLAVLVKCTIITVCG